LYFLTRDKTEMVNVNGDLTYNEISNITQTTTSAKHYMILRPHKCAFFPVWVWVSKQKLCSISIWLSASDSIST